MSSRLWWVLGWRGEEDSVAGDRCDPADTERLVGEVGASPFEMRGKEMDGWLRVSSDAVADDTDLARWIRVGTSYAGSLPPK